MSGGLDLGPCCVCEGANRVRTVLMLPWRAPIPGHGWGCCQCGRPSDGAVAVICDSCFGDGSDVVERLRFACRGYAAVDGRVPIEELTTPFDHDDDAHRETARAPRQAPAGRRRR